MASLTAAHPGAHSGALGSRAVRFFLGFTVFMGGFVFIEPAPYEVVFLAFFALTLLMGLRVAPLISIQILCLVMFNLGGLIAAVGLGMDSKTATYVAISFYLGLTAITFAAIVAEDPERATAIIARAYIASGVLVALSGIAGYFHLFPGADFFTLYDRAKGTFEDPNVYGPFLILPALLLMQGFLSPNRGRFFKGTLPLAIIVIGILLSFSRAAWAHLVVSSACLVYFMFVTSPSNLLRFRIAAVTLLGLASGLVLLAGLLSLPEVSEFFEMRASLVQDYDSGTTGRFGAQLMALPEILKTPFGFGPYEYGVLFGQDPHDVYLNAFAAYGWLGGITYATYVLLTLGLGLRYAFAPVPWQGFHIAAVSAFGGLAMVGFVVDTDHWRHFYLLSGLVWGLTAASVGVVTRARPATSLFVERHIFNTPSS